MEEGHGVSKALVTYAVTQGLLMTVIGCSGEKPMYFDCADIDAYEIPVEEDDLGVLYDSATRTVILYGKRSYAYVDVMLMTDDDRVIDDKDRNIGVMSTQGWYNDNCARYYEIPMEIDIEEYQYVNFSEAWADTINNPTMWPCQACWTNFEHPERRPRYVGPGIEMTTLPSNGNATFRLIQ